MKSRRDIFLALQRIVDTLADGGNMTPEMVDDIKDAKNFMRQPLLPGVKPMFPRDTA